MPNTELPEKCRNCHNCHGLEKGLHTVEDLSVVPTECFIAELDLDEGDRKLISNHKREGAQIALIDSLQSSELITLQETLHRLDHPHYLFNQNPWVERNMALFEDRHKKRPTPEEFLEAYGNHNPRYRVAYSLLFPEMMTVNNGATPQGIGKLRIFLEKADEIAVANIAKYSFLGACHLFRIQMAIAQRTGKPFEPSYVKTIFEQPNL